MANIKIPRKLFEKEIGKLDEKMQERIAMFGTPLESFDDDEIELEIFPNRPDMLSYQGFKRAFLGFLGKKTGMKKYKINSPKKDYKIIVESSVKNIRPYTACAIVKGLKFDDEKIKEIIDIQEKLHLTLGRKRKKFGIGIYPLEKIKLPITYKALEPDKIKFLPLEAHREMSGLEILQQHSAGREYAHLLAGKTKFPIFVDADKNIMSMPPIINSELTGKITEKTKDVFIECSGFDFELLKKCLNIVVTILADMGGEIYQMELKGLKETTPNLTPEKMKISLENTNKVLGLNLNEKQLKQFLEKMGYNYSRNKVEIPSWRTDILHEVDLIEDVAIAYGYENFEPEIPAISTIGEEKPEEIFKRKIAEILTGTEFIEVSNYHLTNKSDQFTKMGIQKKQEKDFIEIEESKTDYNILRKYLAHYLLKNLSENKDSEYPQKIFEIGRVFSGASNSRQEQDNFFSGGRGFRVAEGKKNTGLRANSNLQATKINEKENLAIALTPGNFTELRQVLEYLSRMLGTKLKIKEAENSPNYFISERCAEIWIGDNSKIRENNKTKDFFANKLTREQTPQRCADNVSSGGRGFRVAVGKKQKGSASEREKLIGFLGEIHPKILKNWKIKMPVALCEIELKDIFEMLK